MNTITTSSPTLQVISAEVSTSVLPGTYATSVLMQYFHGSSRSSNKSDSNDTCRLGDTMQACQDRKITRKDLETLEMGIANNRTSFCFENIDKKCKQKKYRKHRCLTNGRKLESCKAERDLQTVGDTWFATSDCNKNTAKAILICVLKDIIQE